MGNWHSPLLNLIAGMSPSSLIDDGSLLLFLAPARTGLVPHHSAAAGVSEPPHLRESSGFRNRHGPIKTSRTRGFHTGT